jgi:two-component system, OmpR family, KDP operon response regulator KdpE
MAKVLLVGEEADTRSFLRNVFERHGFTVLEAEDGSQGLNAAIFGRPELIILNTDLPGIDGADVLERIRSWSDVPIIVLSSSAAERAKVRLLRLGADDYVVKPFGIAELLARSDAALRRHLRSTNREPVVRAGPLSIDLGSRVVTLKGKRIQLTRKEYALLHALATHVGLVVTHQQLIRDIWGAHGGNIQYLRILVRKLRQKIETDPTQPLLIVSESGVGYRLDRGEPGATRGPGDISSDTCCA